MERKQNKVLQHPAALQVLSALLSRGQLMARLGMSYDNERDLYEALGYPLTITYDMYAALYEREAIAKAVINRPVDSTWRGPVTLIESSDADETQLEKAWKELNNRLGLKAKFARLDKLVSLGEYGALLLGLNDTSTSLDFARPVVGSSLELLYVKPLSQASAKIDSWDNDTGSERFGLPNYYNVSISNPGASTTSEIRVHHSRILHVTGELMESEVEGVPVLQSVFNRIKDIEKLIGGSAEMFWRGARPGYQGVVNENYQMSDDVLDALQDQIDEFEHNLRRILVNEGIRFEALASQISDPSSHVDAQLQMISAATGIPKRILTGSERGELASSQDRENWFDLIKARRLEFAEVQIVRPFVNRCVEFGALPPPVSEHPGYSVQWEDLYSPSEMSKAEVGRVRAGALKDYTSTPTAEAVVPPEAFFKFFLGLDEEQAEHIEELQLQGIEEEQGAFEVEE